jgi:flagellar secretion chaperone FliS
MSIGGKQFRGYFSLGKVPSIYEMNSGTMDRPFESPYVTDQILVATPVELIQLLYDKALENVRAARRHLATGDALARSKAISSTLALLTELRCSLNPEAREVSENLANIYRHLQEQLTEAHLNQADAPLAETEFVLKTLADNWKTVMALLAEGPAEKSPSIPTETGRKAALGYDWGLNSDVTECVESAPGRSWSV